MNGAHACRENKVPRMYLIATNQYMLYRIWTVGDGCSHRWCYGIGSIFRLSGGAERQAMEPAVNVIVQPFQQREGRRQLLGVVGRKL